jgi:hypothetical protein
MPLGDGENLGLSTSDHLSFDRCPHCNTANPTFGRKHMFAVQPMKAAYANAAGVMGHWIQWHVYSCESCGGLAGAAALVPQGQINQGQRQRSRWIVPALQVTSSDVPPRARNFLVQARETLSSPAASVMMSASAVDAMLRGRGYKDGSLYARIGNAEKDGVLTANMAEWAHDIRLDANDQRHPDDADTGSSPEDAKRCLEFADALADLLFVLPARVKRGRNPPASPGT